MFLKIPLCVESIGYCERRCLHAAKFSRMKLSEAYSRGYICAHIPWALGGGGGGGGPDFTCRF